MDSQLDEQQIENKREKLLAFIALFIFASSSFLVFNDNLFNKIFGEKVAGNQIAKIKSSRNDIRRRNSKQQAWYSLNRNSGVYENDLLFSGKDSEALVELQNGSLLKLDPNTLISLEKKEDDLELSLKYGKFQGQLNKGQKLKVSIDGKVQELQGGDNSEIIIKKGQNGAEVQVLSGNVKLQGKEIRKDQKVTLSQSGQVNEVKKIEIELLSPATSKEFWLTRNKEVSLTWSVVGQRNYRVLVAKDRSFKQIVLRKNIKNQESFSFSSQETSNYYWMVQLNQEGSSIQSPTRSFQVFLERSPELVRPAQKTQFQVKPVKNIADQTYSWPLQKLQLLIQDTTPSPQHLIEISTSEDFSSDLMRKTTQNKSLSGLELAEGNYFWRARALAQNRPHAPWSKTGSFSIINLESPLNPPKLILSQAIEFLIPPLKYPQEFYSMNASLLSSQLAKYLKSKNFITPELRYSSSPYASSYQFEVQTSSKQRWQSSATPIYLAKSISPSTYQVRARAMGKTKTHFSPWSPTVRLKTVLAPPYSKSQRKFYSTTESKLSLAQKVQLKWTPTLFTKKYRVELADNSRFSQPRQFITANNQINFSIEPNRNFYWRVQALDSQNKTLSNFSRSYPLFWEEKYVAPVSIPRLTKEEPLPPPIEIEEATLDDPSTTPTMAQLGASGQLNRTRAPRFFPWEVQRRNPASRPNYWVKAGTGANYQSLSNESGSQSFNVDQLGGPTAYVNAGLSSEVWGVDFSYKRKPTDFSQNSSPSVSNQSFNWQTFILEGLYSFQKVFTLLGLPTESRIRAGVKRQTLPIIADNGSATLDLLSATLTELTLGVDFTLARAKRLRYEFFARYNYPMQSSIDSQSSFSISPQFSFDSGVGVVYRMTPTSYLGAKWEAQFQKNNFSLQNGSTNADGSQSSIFSNIDTHFGFEF